MRFSFRRPALAAALVLVSLTSLGGCAIHVTTTGDGLSSKLQRSGGTSKFQCIASPSGQCNYALYTSRCTTVDGEGGKPATTCTHQVFDQFTLASGQSREIGNLPGDYKQCMKPGSKPEVPNCD